MKKLLIGLAFSFICFSGFALEDPWNACGEYEVSVLAASMKTNFCEGTYQVLDVCSEIPNDITTVIAVVDGPNSSCGGLPVIPE